MPALPTTQRPDAWFGYDPATGKDQAFYLFICNTCDRQHNSPSSALPEGWHKMAVPEFGETILQCPDCDESIEREKSEKIRRVAKALAIFGIHPPLPRQPTTPNPFSMHLQRQQDGAYLIAITPETALMRLSPLEFFLSAEGARLFARDLLRHADLVAAPGTTPVSITEGTAQ